MLLCVIWIKFEFTATFIFKDLSVQLHVHRLLVGNMNKSMALYRSRVGNMRQRPRFYRLPVRNMYRQVKGAAQMMS